MQASLRKIIGAFKQKIAKPKGRSSMMIVWFYCGGLMLLTILMVIAWLAKWWIDGVPDIDQLLRVFQEYTGGTVVAAFAFAVAFNIDKNHDGRPDPAEVLAKNGMPPAPPMGGMRR